MAVTPWRLQYLMILTYLAVRCQATNDVILANWRRLSPYNAATYQLSVRSRSRVECIRECMKHSHCSRVAYQSLANVCLLQPGLPPSQSESSANDVVIYKKKGAICMPYEAPSIHNANVTWSRTLTSMTGNVTCDVMFMLTSSPGIVNCDANNNWETKGQCVQHKWTSISQDYNRAFSVPLPVKLGWKMCFHGVQAADTDEIWMSLYDSNGDRPMKMIFYFKVNDVPNHKAKFNSYINGSFANQQTVTDQTFPLTEATPFYMEIRAPSTYSLEIHVDQKLFYTYTTLVPVTSVTKARFSNILLQSLDMWC